MNQPPPHDPATSGAAVAFTAGGARARGKRMRDQPLPPSGVSDTPPRAVGAAAPPTQDHEESA